MQKYKQRKHFLFFSLYATPSSMLGPYVEDSFRIDDPAVLLLTSIMNIPKNRELLKIEVFFMLFFST